LKNIVEKSWKKKNIEYWLTMTHAFFVLELKIMPFEKALINVIICIYRKNITHFIAKLLGIVVYYAWALPHGFTRCPFSISKQHGTKRLHQAQSSLSKMTKEKQMKPLYGTEVSTSIITFTAAAFSGI